MPEDLEQAIEKVRTGRITYRAAFDIYGVPKSMLSDQINKHSAKDQPNKSGPECFLSDRIERCIYQWLLKMAQIGYRQMKPNLFDHVQLIVHRLKIKTPFKDDHPGEKWHQPFLTHYPNLMLHQVHMLSKLHAGVSHHALDKWIQELHEYLLEMGNFDILDQPNCICNCDKTGFPMAPHPTKVIASKGDPYIYQQGELTKAQITILTVSATAH